MLDDTLDYQIQSAIYALRNKDPNIYDENYYFIKPNESKNDKNDINDKWVNQTNNKNDENFLKQFFKNKLWKLDDKDNLSNLESYRGYSGLQWCMIFDNLSLYKLKLM